MCLKTSWGYVNELLVMCKRIILCLVTVNASGAGRDFALIQTSLITSYHKNNLIHTVKSLSKQGHQFKGQVTEQTTV